MYIFLKFTDQSFFLSSKGMYFLCTTNLITSHKNQHLSSKGMYFLCTTNLITSHKNQSLFIALGGWLEEKNRPKKVIMNKYVVSCVLLFVQFFKIYLSIFFFSSNGMYFLCTTNFNISYTNQPLCLKQDGRLEKKIGQIRSQSKWVTMNK